MYTPAGFTAMEVGATVLLANLPYALAFGLMLDLSLVLGAERLAPIFRVGAQSGSSCSVVSVSQGRRLPAARRLRKAPVRLGGWAVNLPTPAMTALQLVVGLIDLTLVSNVMYMLLPESANIGYLPSWPCTSRACSPAC